MPKSFEFNNTKSLKNDKKDPKKSPLYSAIKVLPKKRLNVTVSKKQMEDCKEPCDR
jgi:hypothetical protein